MYDIGKVKQTNASQVPQPVGFNILVALPEVKEKTEGGVFIPDATRNREETASILGFVMKMGSDAYKDRSIFGSGPWCKEGDWVMFRSYSGMRVTVHGQEFRILKDSEVVAVVDNPAGIIRSGKA